MAKAGRDRGSSAGGKTLNRDAPPRPAATFGFRIHRDYTALFFPWWGTMSYGIAEVGEPGAGVWRARTRERLIRKMERSASKLQRRWGYVSPPEVEVSDDYETA